MNLDKYKNELLALIEKGKHLLYSLAEELDLLNAAQKKKLKEKFPSFLSFNDEYELWYSEARSVIKQIIPDRLSDFNTLYKNEKRKDVDYLTYTISDKLIGLVTKYGNLVKVDESAAYPKFKQQIHILESAERRFDSSLFELRQVVQADIFDNELDSATELLKHGFLRAAGAVSGVVLEKHLKEVCLNHVINIIKKNPSIGDYNDLIRNNNVIEIPTWRFIQHLADIRNLCDHSKDREPTKDEISDLVTGVRRITKTVF